MRPECILAVDIGTTGAKATVVLRSGEVIGSAYRGYPTMASGPRVEQDPADWEKAALGALRELASGIAAGNAAGNAARPAAIAVTGQMQDLVVYGQGGTSAALGPAILYSDTRAGREAALVAEVRGEDRLVREARNAQDPTGLAPKLLWLRENEAAVYRDAGLVLFGAHDHVALALCGKAGSDLTTASTTGLLDLDRNAWNLSLLEALGLRTDFLPDLVPADGVLGGLSRGAAGATGLPEGLPVVHCAGDAATTTLGAGAGVDGVASINLGTSGWLAMTKHGGPVDPRKGVYNLRHPDGAGLILIGAPSTAAGNLDWLRSALFPGMESGEAFALLNAEAEAAPPASLLYLPWLSGERSPFKDPDARAAFIGMGRETTRGDLARAVLEGVAFSLKSVHDAIYETESGAAAPAAATLVGGGARSALWGRILASVLGCPMLVPENPADAGARGAAILAGRALGWYGDYALPGGLAAAARREPEPAWSRAYGALYPAYAAMHDPLRAVFSEMASMRSRA